MAKTEMINGSEFINLADRLTVDSELDVSSIRPIQNQVVAKKFNEVEKRIGSISECGCDVVQTTGQSTTAMMSQKATTDALGRKQDSISDLAAIRSNAAKGASASQPSDLAKKADVDYVDSLHAEEIESRQLHAIPVVSEQPMILFGNGTPQEAIVPDNWVNYDVESGRGYEWTGQPIYLGQTYINYAATSNGRYTAVPNGTQDLKWVNF